MQYLRMLNSKLNSFLDSLAINMYFRKSSPIDDTSQTAKDIQRFQTNSFIQSDIAIMFEYVSKINHGYSETFANADSSMICNSEVPPVCTMIVVASRSLQRDEEVKISYVRSTATSVTFENYLKNYL